MDPVDFYCERVVAGFGGEPLNALSALAFLGVGIWRLRAAPEAADRHAALALMLLGVAACLHHLAAVRLTLWLDIWTNILFLAVFGGLFLRRLAGTGAAAILAAGIVVVALTELLGAPPVRAVLGIWADMFAVETALLAVLSVATYRHAPGTARGFAVGAFVLAAGLPFRFLDQTVCTAFPLGTHWLWHLFNAGSIAVVLTALAGHGTERRA